jgi:hypothetical protein
VVGSTRSLYTSLRRAPSLSFRCQSRRPPRCRDMIVSVGLERRSVRIKDVRLFIERKYLYALLIDVTDSITYGISKRRFKCPKEQGQNL